MERDQIMAPTNKQLVPFLKGVTTFDDFYWAVQNAHQKTDSDRSRFGELYARMLELFNMSWYVDMPLELDPFDVNWVDTKTHNYVRACFAEKYGDSSAKAHSTH